MRLVDYEQLPGLLSRKQFKALTGLNDRDLRAALDQGQIGAWVRPCRVYRRAGRRYRPRKPRALYYKVDVLRFNPILKSA